MKTKFSLPLMTFFLLLFAPLSLMAQSTAKEKAWRMHNRLAGVPPTPDVQTQMELLINIDRYEDAAKLAIDHPLFYSVTLKKWVKAWSNVEESNRVNLNDYVATVIGMVRDDVPFDSVLYGDHLYVVEDESLMANYSSSNNNHYREAEDKRLNLKDSLVYRSQSELNGINDTAGVITTRASGEAFFSAGTNRRVTRFTFMNFLCKDFEALHDVSVPDVYVRRDVERDPGGDSRTYRNSCVGCHAGQDALGGAFAYFDFVDGELVYNPGEVSRKINLNNLFTPGHVVEDDSWMNLWSQGINSSLGWRGDQSGQGVRELGRMLAKSQAFSQCMATKVYKLVCLKDAQQEQVNQLVSVFEREERYSMKELISSASGLCFRSAQ